MPNERSRVLVIDSKVITDGTFKFDRAAVRPTLDLTLGEQRKPAFHEVEPGPGSRCEMQVETRMARKPRAHRRSFVRTVIVHDQMNGQVGWHILLDGTQEFQELRSTMTSMQLAHDLAGGQIQCGEQRGCTMPHIVMAAPLGHAKRQ